MKRRDFISLFAQGLAAWPLAAYAQQKAQLPTVGVIMGFSSKDPATQPGVKAFETGLAELGWNEGRTIHLDYRWAELSGMPATAASLVASKPQVIVAAGTSILAAVHQATQSIPVVFIGISDPEGVGVVANLARPGGNMTGVANFEPSMGGKWLQTLKEIAPQLTRVGVLRVGKQHARILQSVESDGVASGMEVVDCSVLDEGGLRAAIGAFDGQSSTGLIVASSSLALTERRLLLELVARHKLPAVYSEGIFVADGGLMSYAPDIVDQFRRAAGYVDRILKGEKAADMPVQTPVKYVLSVNLKTAKALGLAVPPTLLTIADEVIE